MLTNIFTFTSTTLSIGRSTFFVEVSSLSLWLSADPLSGVSIPIEVVHGALSALFSPLELSAVPSVPGEPLVLELLVLLHKLGKEEGPGPSHDRVVLECQKNPDINWGFLLDNIQLVFFVFFT